MSKYYYEAIIDNDHVATIDPVVRVRITIKVLDREIDFDYAPEELTNLHIRKVVKS